MANVRAGKLRHALDQIRRDTACGWSRQIAAKAMDADDDIKVGTAAPSLLDEGQCGTRECGEIVYYSESGPTVYCDGCLVKKIESNVHRQVT